MSLGVIVVCYRRRNQTRNDSESDHDWKNDNSPENPATKNW
jgi:hypothetical protein